MSVIEEVCSVRGHNLQSYVVADVVDPILKIVVHRYEFRCNQCTKTLDEIAKYKISSRGTARKRNGKSNVNDSSAKTASEAGAGKAASEVAQPESVHRSESSMLEPGVQPGSDEPPNRYR